MKKLLFAIYIALISTTGIAQIERGESAIVIQTGVDTNPTRLMVGGSWRYCLFNNFRFAGDAKYLFPNDRTFGINIEADLHYLIPIEAGNETMYAYPIIGGTMLNNRFMGRKVNNTIVTEAAYGTTKAGFNLGGGYELHISSSAFLNSEIKYIFGKADSFTWSLGVGFRL